MAVIGDNEEIMVIDCRTADTKYTILAALVNWRINAFGKYVSKLYFVVLISLNGRSGLFYLPKKTLRWPVHTFVNKSPIYLLSLYYQYKNDIRLLFIWNLWLSELSIFQKICCNQYTN